MVAALRTGLGKVPGSRLWALGTRPASEDHFFSKMLAGGADYSQSHDAPAGLPMTHRRTWLRANPSLPIMPHLEEKIRAELAKALDDPELLPAFEALRLNRGVSDTAESFLLDAGTWQRIEAQAARSGPYALGVDLGSSAAMSAAAGYWPNTGALEAFAVFPELPALPERGLRDGVGDRYVKMHREGSLRIAGRRVSSIPALLRHSVERWGVPAVIVTDRWREPELREALEDSAFPLNVSLVTRGQGWKDGGEDVRRFRAAALAGDVKPERSLLLRSAMSEARTVSDTAGNAKLAKGAQGGRRAKARDDAAAASILAVAEGDRRRGAMSRPARFAVA